MAEEFEYQNGPDDNGEMFIGPGKPVDYMPKPYPNDESALAVSKGLNYNPYFAGNAIDMAQILFDGITEHEYDTPAIAAQMAKNVCTFLAWVAEPEHGERKNMGMKVTIIIVGLTALVVCLKKFKSTPLKTRKIVYK